MTAPLVAFCTKLIPSFATCTTEISPNLPGRGYHPVAVLAVVVHCILFGVSEREPHTHEGEGAQNNDTAPAEGSRGELTEEEEEEDKGALHVRNTKSGEGGVGVR